MQEKEDMIKCSLVDDLLEIGDCVVYSDVAAGLLKENCIPKEYSNKYNWREICRKCKYHNM